MLDTDRLIRMLALIGWLLWLTPHVSLFGISERGKRWFYLALGLVLTTGFAIAIYKEIEWLLHR
jgi:hypothetical protein